jgi:hypothetical protein
MSHFAKVIDGVVVRVIVAEQDFINSGLVGDAFLWIQTSYNKNFRKNYASIDMLYDQVRDAFYWSQPFPSWTLNEDTCQWESPVPHPTDDKRYEWIEETTNWKEII